MKQVKIFGLCVVAFMVFGLSYFCLEDNYNLNSLVAENIDYSNDNNYSVIFDANGGELNGFASYGYEKIRDGVYGISDSSIKSQPINVEYSKKDNYYILYWSKDHNCSTKDLNIGSDFDTSNHTVYYACYEESDFDNNGIRYAMNNAYVSGDNVGLGDALHITNCYKKWKYNSARDFGSTEYCEFDEINGEKASGIVYRMQLDKEKVDNYTNTYNAYFYEDSVGIDGDGLECGNTNFYSLGVCTISGSINQSVSTPDASNLVYNGKKFIGWAADDDGKNVNCSGDLVTGGSVKLSENVNYYACYEEDTNSCQNSEKITNGKGEYEVKVCYEAYNEYGELLVRAKSDDIDELVSCADGFTLDNVTKTNIVDTTCKKEGDCYRKYNVSCAGERPKISASVGMVQDNGKGYVNFSGESSVGIKAYYASSYYLKPTKNSSWINDSRGNYSISSTPGIVFLWVMDNNDQISYAAMTSVIDKINTDTTLKTLEIKGSNGETLNTETYAFDESSGGITSSDYVRLSNSLINESMLAKGFNPFDTAYKVTTSSEKISVYATLTSNDASYVEGYEPREVMLDYGVNTILIKIQNKKGKIRTYTIIVTREDDRDNSNYLKSITLSSGKIKFDQYTNDYVVSVAKNKKSVSVGAELASLNASFVDSYGPRKVELKNESTTMALKVRSETGSIRAYTITFVKDGEETKENNEALLSSLSLSKAYVAFDSNVSDYNTTVDYEIDSIDIYALSLNGKDAVNLYRTINGVTEKIDSKNIILNVGYNNITIIVSTENGKSRTYTVNILRKEDGLEISSETALSMLGVDGYDIKFSPEKLDYQIKIKNEKTLVIAATPMSNRADVYIRGNDNLTAFSIVKIKVVSEDGQFKEYTIDIQKDTFNKNIERLAFIGGVIIIVCGIIIIRVKKKRKSINNYYA